MAARHASRGFGALLHTDVDRVDLGTHHGHALRARVERRSARLTAGRGWHLSLGLGRTRPVAIEVTRDGRRYDLPVPRTRDPWLEAARRLLALSLATALLLALAARRRKQQAAP